MKIRAIKTHKIIPEKENNLFLILDRYLPKLKEGVVVAVSSKIAAICEGQYKKVNEIDKDKVIQKEAEWYLPRDENGFYLTIKHNLLIPSAGIDESNGDGYYILWPKDSQKTANSVRAYLAKKHGIKKVGVLIADSKTTPLRWGVTGTAVAHSGFAALHSYIGEQDVFGRELQFTKTNVMDGLAASAVLLMGEGKEQTPFAVIENIPHVKFQQRNPTQKELQDIRINLGQDDIYKGLLRGVKWRKGGS